MSTPTPLGVLVDAPTVTPYPFGLLSVAQFPLETDEHWPAGIQWEEHGAAQAFTAAGWEAPALAAITHNGPGDNTTTDPGVPFGNTASIAVYALVDVTAVGRDPEAAQTLAREKCSLAAPRALEAAVWTGLDSSGDPTGAKALAATDTVVLGGGTAVDAVAGLGLLEEWLGSNYAGVGVIHATRGVSATFDRWRLAQLQSGKKTTGLGNLVAFGAGYDGSGVDNTAAPAGQAWVYATPAVSVRQGLDVVTPVDTPHAFGYAKNRIVMVVERQYAVAWEGIAAAALITLGA